MLYGQIKLAYHVWQDAKAKSKASSYGYVYLGSGGDSHLFQDPKTKQYFEQHNLEENKKPVNPLKDSDIKAYIKKYYNL